MKKIFGGIVVVVLFIISSNSISAQVINEFVPNATTEWIEIHSASSSAEYLKSYYLDDDTDFNSDSGSSAKKLLTDLNISNANYPYLETSSFLNNSGDYVVLFDQNGTIVDQYQYNSDPGSGVSIGRSPDTTGNFAILTSATEGGQNSSAATAAPTTTPTPTAAPTAVPTAATPIKTATPVPTKTPTPRPSPTTTDSTSDPSATPDATGVVLSASDDLPTQASPISEADSGSKNKFPFIAVGVILIGVGFLGFAFWPLIVAKLHHAS